MERLNELPFVELKLDRSYVSGCSSDAHKRAICHSVVSLARRSGVRTVAEGIEAAADLKTLKEMGYHAGQGFIFAKPMPRDEFVELLLQRAVQKVS
jgi:EAL domain-containing protein (putative c-di-GMP-specific phosphodiesterase class I)